MDDIDLSIIVANYNTRNYLKKCLESIYNTTSGINFEVIVVDDFSPDDSVDMVKEYFPQVRLICNPVNLRYTKTNNNGLKAAKGRYGLLLNSDVEVQPGAFLTLVKFMDENPDVAAAGPKLINPDGTIQHCIRGFPDILPMILQSIGIQKLFPGNRFTERYYCTKFDYFKTQQVEHIGTTAFIIRRQTWQNYDMLDEKFDFFMVDFAYCLMLKHNKQKVYYVHDAVVMHHGSVTINMNGEKEIKQLHDGLYYFYEKFYAFNHSLIKKIFVKTGIKIRLYLKLLIYKLSAQKTVLSGIAFNSNIKSHE